MLGINKRGQNVVASLDVLQPRHANFNLDWLVYGWAVAPISNWNQEFTNIFLSWFESCSPNFNKNDHTTWKPANMPIMVTPSYSG